MKKLVGMIALIFVCAGAALGGDQAADIADTLEKLEQDYGKAIMDVDLERIDQIMADDWRGVGESGRAATKANALELVRSRKSRLEWFAIGPRDVKVVGDDVAVVQASVSERRNVGGVPTSLTVVYLDVWVKRGDRWLLLRSQTSKLK